MRWKDRRGLIGAAIITAAVVGIGAATPVAAFGAAGTTASEQVAQYDGKDLFHAVYFGVGDATALLKDKPGFDYLEDLEGNSDPEVVEVITDITDRIETAKPGLLDSTVDELRSGDPYLVQSAVDDINLVLGVTLEERAAEYEDDPGAVTPLALVAVLGPVFHVGAVVTGAVVVAIVAAVVTVGAFWSRSAGAEQQREQGIADLTAALAQ
jgi:SdpC family antimicrobial peptide